jgi:hypothetical protein
MNRLTFPVCACFVALSLGCDDDKKKDTPMPAAQPSTSAAASAGPAGSTTIAAASAGPRESPPAAGATRFAVVTGKGAFLIDAPLEKIKGSSDELRGHLDVNLKEIGKSTGDIMVRLSTLRTNTFQDNDKNVAQTGHARNWMEVGNDSPAEARMKYEWADFVVTAIDATPSALSDAKDEGGSRTIKAKVSGDLTLHGVTSKKTVPVTVTFKGTADSPTELDLKTDQPMPVSMKEQGVMPRDTLGGILNGALDRIGKKIDDIVQVSFDAVAKPTMPAQP